MPADYGRIHRLLKILTIIQGSRGWTASKLARECGVTQRTIFRDLDMLEGAGIPYFYDEQTKGYSIRGDFFMPPLQLTLDETLALSALAEHVGVSEQVPFFKSAGRAIAKVKSQLPPKIRKELDGLENHLSIKLSPSNPPEASEDVYETVRAALAAKLALSCKYESVSGAADGKPQREFLFKPYALLFSQRAWYAMGHHSRHNEVRCLKLNRFSKIAMTEESFAIPKSFSMDKHLGNAWRMIRGNKSYRVELWFDSGFAETIADTHWHPTQDVQWNDDGSITFTCKVDGLEEIVWWVLSMGPHCVVKKPRELAERTKLLAMDLVKRYEP